MLNFEAAPSFERPEPEVESVVENPSAPKEEQSFQDALERHETRAESYAGRLAEYVTGLKLDDPALIDRLTSDKAAIRGKYHLPSRNMPPYEYERALRSILTGLNTRIKDVAECGKLLETAASAVYLENQNVIGVSIDRNSDEYFRGLNELEHETIHAIQNHETPSMPIERMEYEAYLAGANLDAIAEDEEGPEVLFGFLIGGSVNWHYNELSEREGRKIRPSWDKSAEVKEEDEVVRPSSVETSDSVGQ